MADAITAHLAALYGAERAPALRARVDGLLVRHGPAIAAQRPRALALDERDALLITYADQVQAPGQPPLATLADFCARHLRGLISAVHLLPFFPYSSDDGFAVIDYRAVRESYGTWEDVRRLGRDFALMFDAVINHTSAQSPWFQGFLAGDARWREHYIAAEGDPDLSAVVRPRTSPLLTTFDSARGPLRVWTTFSGDQVDLNYASPEVLLEILDVLLGYVAHGAAVLRLDAIAYLWKEAGTPCVHLPQTHRAIKLIRAVIATCAPAVKLITETNVPHADNVSYFGDGSDEAHLVYNFALPPLVLHTLLDGDARALSAWAEGLRVPGPEVAFFNFLASHDGVGLNAARGLLSAAQLDALVARVQAHGGLVSEKSDAQGGQSPYELNASYLDALSDPAAEEPPELAAARFAAAHAMMLALPGIPALYFHSLFGSRGWPEGVQRSGHNRAVNRQRCHRDALERELADPRSLRSRVFARLADLLRTRAACAALHPAAEQRILGGDPRLFGVLRTAKGRGQRVLCVQNVSASHVALPASWCATLAGGGPVQSLLGGDADVRELEPYQTLWLRAVPRP